MYSSNGKQTAKSAASHTEVDHVSSQDRTPGQTCKPGQGPYSRLLARGEYDGRSREGRYLRACKRELERELGGKLTTAQRILVERVCFLRLRAALFDERLLMHGKELGELDYRVYCAISNALVRATRELGLKHSATTELPSFTKMLADMAGAA